MKVPHIQYITHPNEDFDDLSWVHRLHAGGILWIQLRIKEEDIAERFPGKHYLAFFHDVADRMRAITSALGMLLTINDVQEVALFSHADGLHIGQEDVFPDNMSRLEGPFIMGGTANSFEEINHFTGVPMTYFGIGPLRTTATKRKLKPVIGFEGYRKIIFNMQQTGLKQPVFAIGGILPSDIHELKAAGVYGIAVSGALFNMGHNVDTVREFTEKMKDYEVENKR